MSFKIGDKVKIKNFGRCYTTYKDWFIENDIPREDCIGFCYGMNAEEAVVNAEDTIFTVIAKGLHNSNEDMLYLIKVNGHSKKSFLIGESGIEHYYDCEQYICNLEDKMYSALLNCFNDLERGFDISLGKFDDFYNKNCSDYINDIANRLIDKVYEA